MYRVLALSMVLALASIGVAARSGLPGRNHHYVGELPPDMQMLEPGFKPAFEEGHIQPALKGTWRSRGYGFLLDLTDEEPDVFIEAGTMCWHTDLGRSHSFRSYTLAAYRFEEDNQAIFTAQHGGTKYTYDRLVGLPSACRTNLPATAATVFDALWQSMEDRYAFFQLRDVDWRARRDQYRPKALAASNDAQLYEALAGVISGFGDGHLTIAAEIGGEKRKFRELRPMAEALLHALHAEKDGHLATDIWEGWVKSDQARIVEQLMKRRAHHPLQGHMLWGMVDKDVGYISIDMLADYGAGAVDKDAVLAATEFDHALEALEGVRAMILDLTQNRGGDDRIARVIASRFTDKECLAYTKQARGSTPQTLYLFPAGPRQFLKPVYLITSNLTGSAAEVLTLALRALPNLCHVGESTGGALSDLLQTPLPNGWLLTLSNEIYRDPSGHLYESKGLPPEKDVKVFPLNNLTAGHVEAIRKVVQLAKAGTGCRN